jgi:molecular chaperone GrpE
MTRRKHAHAPDITPAVEPTADAAGTPPEVTLTALEEQLATEQARAEEYRDSWMRERADFVNYRRRVDAERAEVALQANEALLRNLLPVLDDFDLALAHVPAEARATKWVEGILLIQRKLLTVLDTAGVTTIPALGEPFDPNLHEAVMADDHATEPYTVVTDLRRGYRLGERVLRPSMVRVGNAPTATQ